MAKERSARSRRGGVWPTLLAWLSVIALIASALLMAGAGPAYRWELISLGDAFSLMRNGVYAATAAVAISILLLLFRCPGRLWLQAARLNSFWRSAISGKQSLVLAEIVAIHIDDAIWMVGISIWTC